MAFPPEFSSTEMYENKYDLDELNVFIEGNSNNPMYFDVSGLPNKATYGKHYFNISILSSEISEHKFDVQTKRYHYYLKILEKNNYDKILICDSRDIYFQSDPFQFNYQGSINFFLEDEKIKNCIFNSNWLIKTHGKKVFENMKNKTILCSGTILADNSSMIKYLNLMV